ncbi:hypothetical protein CISIN_1g0107631mg, partial [Citrus sinensis]
LDSTVYASMGVQLQPHHPHHGLTMPPQSHEVLLRYSSSSTSLIFRYNFISLLV